MRRVSATGRVGGGPRLNLDTPMLAGEEPGNRLWFAALHPLADLIETVSGGRPHGGFMDLLVNTPFTEVYTDSGQRPYGRHPGCCVADLFTYALNPTEHRIISMRVTNRIAAEWGQLQLGSGIRGVYEERVRRWRSKPLDYLIPADMEPMQLIRFRIDEEGMQPFSTSWVENAAGLLNFALRAFNDQIQGSFSFPLHTRIGTFTDEGYIPFGAVARYFYDLPRRHFQGSLGDMIPGGYAEGRDPSEFDPRELRAGIRVEMEHTRDPRIAREIAMDHLVEDPLYYRKLKRAGL